MRKNSKLRTQNSKPYFRYAFLVILAITAVLRLWGLGSNPPHLTNDEAALGYNAYSILRTGKDEHGAFLPIIFQSFGDWKPGLYIYLTVPSVAIFGLNEFATRLPGALAGIAAVGLMYLVVLSLFKDKGRKLGLLAAFFLAVSPWHLQFSRGAWEANLSLTLVLAAIYFFLRGLRGGNALLFSALFFGLSLLSYQGAKLGTGFVILLLIVFFRKQLFSLPRKVLIKSFALLVLLSLPVVFSFFQGKTGRLEVYSVFSYPRSEVDVQRALEQGGETGGSLTYLLYHSEPLHFTRGILGRFFNHYDARFLFFEGDWANPRHGAPNAGMLLLLDAVFLLIGLVVLSRLGRKRKALFLWGWLLLASLPSALSRDSVNAVRAFSMVAPLTIILALGAAWLIERRKTFSKFVMLAYVLFPMFYALNFFYYLDQYWVHLPQHNSQNWEYGYKQMVETVTHRKDAYDKVIIQQSYSQPYIFFLFYNKYDPARYQSIAGDVYIPSPQGDVGLISRVENIEFREINWAADKRTPSRLIVAPPEKIPVEDEGSPEDFRFYEEIKYLNETIAFKVYGTKSND